MHFLNVPGLCFHIWPDDGFYEPKHVAEFLILIIIYIVLLAGIDYYIIAIHSGMTPVKTLTWNLNTLLSYSSTNISAPKSAKAVCGTCLKVSDSSSFLLCLVPPHLRAFFSVTLHVAEINSEVHFYFLQVNVSAVVCKAL